MGFPRTARGLFRSSASRATGQGRSDDRVLVQPGRGGSGQTEPRSRVAFPPGEGRCSRRNGPEGTGTGEPAPRGSSPDSARHASGRRPRRSLRPNAAGERKRRMGSPAGPEECRALEELAPADRRNGTPPQAGRAANRGVRPAPGTEIETYLLAGLHSPTRTPPNQVYRDRMALSARNQLRGQISDVTLGEVMAHVTVQIGDNEIESVITRRSAEEMKLKAGDAVTVVIKSTEVMIQK